jgi:tRNA modification GTPase
MANDTIAAIATPPGTGGIGIVRVSGEGVPRVILSVTCRAVRERIATFTDFRHPNGPVIDRGIALYFRAPHSYTGEDVLELQGHGGRVVMQEILTAVLAAGARQARPGEFSERAFLNDKLDLAQAEAVADLINAGTERAARSALRTLSGEYSTAVNAMVTRLQDLRVNLEAALDFPDDHVAPARGAIAQRIADLVADLDRLGRNTRRGVLVNAGIELVIAGAPNVGKSSLLNRLTRADTAITSAIPGTTRDVIRANVAIAGIPVRVTDTAGLRAAEDEIEREGIRRATAAIGAADIVLLLTDRPDADAAVPADLMPALAKGATLVHVHNKIDLYGLSPSVSWRDSTPRVFLSALTGEGVPALEETIARLCGLHDSTEHEFAARARHAQAFDDAAAALARASATIAETDVRLELVAEDARLAQRALEVITGRVDAERLLGEIFSRFCIGK